ncbi:hypothetical protein [Myroides odoratus]|uniref:hypothetical protein n=1 Tax=Myroides odoratus TaxID=256 RepID=UPI00334286D6
MDVIIILALIVFCIVGIVYSIKKLKKQNQWKKDFDVKSFVRSGSLVYGHPDIDRTIKLSGFHLKNNNIELYEYYDEQFNIKALKVGDIPFDRISNILSEDQSTIESRISATRLYLVGVFALAWKKREKHELGYLTVFWNDGKFDHETVFEFEGKNAVQRANMIRNLLIKILR